MKQLILILVLNLYILSPQWINAQEQTQKEINKIEKLGLHVDNKMHLTYPQAGQLMSIWDSLYDIGKKQHVNNALADSTWEHLLLQEINRAVNQNNQKNVIRLKYYLAHLYHAQKQFTKSIPIQNEIILSKQYLTKLQIQKTYTKLERAYVLSNQLRKALDIRKERLALKQIESSYDLYQDFELYEMALNDFKLIHKIKFGKPVEQYKYYRTIGVLYYEMGKIDSAKKFFTIGLNLSIRYLNNEALNNQRNIHQHGKASFLGYLGRCYLAEGQYQKAITLLLQDIQHSDEDESNKIFKTMHLTNAYIFSKNAKNAKKYIDQLEGLILKKEDKRMVIRMSEIKSNYFELVKQYDSALFYSKLYIQQKAIQTESIKNNQAILLLSNLEAEARKKNLLITREILDKERIEKKAQQQLLWASFIIVLLTTTSLIILYISNIQKSKSKKLIEKKNEENELLLKELHHRVKNNLQIIYSLINLQKRRLETKELNHSLSMVQNRIKTMSLVHQNLHDNESFKEVNLNAYIKTITDYLKTLYHNDEKEINFKLNIFSTIELSMDRAITIGLLLNEIISNSLKYAFKGRTNGLIQVEVIPIHDGFQMKISDDGIGFNTEQTNSKSLGMYLIKNLVKQIQGKYELEHFNGTAYTIYFKA